MAKILTKAVTRLQKFLAAIAGDATAPIPVTNQERLLFNIAEEMKATSASGMPTVTAANAGQVATVNNSGVWVAANPSSGGGDVVVSHITSEPTLGEPVFSCDMTESEITSAIEGGKTVLAVYGGSAISVWLDSLRVDFVVVSGSTNKLMYMRFIYEDGALERRMATYTLTPET